jgi:hypothetical protein
MACNILVSRAIMINLRTVILITALANTLGCARYFAPDINLNRYVSTNELVGTWDLAPGSLKLAVRDGYVPPKDANHQITFLADGTCRFASFVPFGRRTYYVSATGTWELAHDKDFEGNSKGIKNTLDILVQSAGWTMYFTEENGKVILWDFWGDPDQWEFTKYGPRG